MAISIEERLNDLYRKLGAAMPPQVITQVAFDFDPGHLERLAALHPGERANVWDLANYVDDLLYQDIQPSLLVHVLPFCLRAWHEYVRNERFECPGFAQSFCSVLEKREVFACILTEYQTNALLEFMSGSILEEIDAQDRVRFEGYSAPPYRWIRALMTYGVIAPDIEHLWMDWWSISTVGRAIAAVQFISCLVYRENENRVFAPKTREKGGGPPCLWEFDGCSNDSTWKIKNVEFLQRLLRDPNIVFSVVSRAVDRLSQHSGFQTAQQLLADSQSQLANRNVWSAAVLQAKSEDDRIGLRECIRP
ncbi:MAG: hypothetical protein WBW38_07220 [Candidatus Sulfotelmatobacter sp.]